jgi:endoglucanase
MKRKPFGSVFCATRQSTRRPASWHPTLSLALVLLGCGTDPSQDAGTQTSGDDTATDVGSTTGSASSVSTQTATTTDGASTALTSGPNTPSATSTWNGTSDTSVTNSSQIPDATTGTPTDSTSDPSVTSTTTASSADSSAQSSSDPSVTPQTAAELIAKLDIGWNLGNSLDVPEGETEWGNPVVDAAMLKAVADAGFKVVRIPATWSLFTGSAPGYTIDAARLSRVETVVNYALEAGLHVIINLHHDGADDYDGVEWLRLNDDSGAITDANNAAVEARFRAVWTQLADHFKAFDQRLLFESMNEIHDGYDAPDPAYYDIINNLNQVFVDIVRASGGNNATRHLVVPGYNTNIEYTLAGFETPQDPTPDHLILSVHYYDPWDFAGEGSSPAWGNGAPGADTWGQEDHVTTQFDALKSAYIDKGLPMIIGEYGAVNVTGSEDYRRYYMEYVTQAACQRGIVPIYWDNGGLNSGPDSFGLFNRTSKQVTFPDILEAMFRGCGSTQPLESIAKP